MNEILAATKAQLQAREAELEALLADREKLCQEIANEANQRINAIRAELANHAEELTGVRHSTATVEQVQKEAPNG